MDDGVFNPKGFSGTVPVFPLPSVVLFPGMFLPLHIFEPRYRAMTADALKGERLIAMALLKPGWEKDYEGTPAIQPTLGLGKIIEDVRLEDGRFNLVLLGMARVRVIEEVGKGPYRVARVEPIEDRPAPEKEYERKRHLLLALYVQVMKDLMKGAVPAPPEDVPLGMLCDLLSSLIGLDLRIRQELLEQPDVAVRCDRLLDLIQGRAPESGGTPRPKRPWSRDPSLN